MEYWTLKERIEYLKAAKIVDKPAKRSKLTILREKVMYLDAMGVMGLEYDETEYQKIFSEFQKLEEKHYFDVCFGSNGGRV